MELSRRQERLYAVLYVISMVFFITVIVYWHYTEIKVNKKHDKRVLRIRELPDGTPLVDTIIIKHGQ